MVLYCASLYYITEYGLLNNCTHAKTLNLFHIDNNLFQPCQTSCSNVVLDNNVFRCSNVVTHTRQNVIYLSNKLHSAVDGYFKSIHDVITCKVHIHGRM